MILRTGKKYTHIEYKLRDKTKWTSFFWGADDLICQSKGKLRGTQPRIHGDRIPAQQVPRHFPGVARTSFTWRNKLLKRFLKKKVNLFTWRNKLPKWSEVNSTTKKCAHFLPGWIDHLYEKKYLTKWASLKGESELFSNIVNQLIISAKSHKLNLSQQ